MVLQKDLTIIAIHFNETLPWNQATLWNKYMYWILKLNARHGVFLSFSVKLWNRENFKSLKVMLCCLLNKELFGAVMFRLTHEIRKDLIFHPLSSEAVTTCWVQFCKQVVFSTPPWPSLQWSSSGISNRGTVKIPCLFLYIIHAINK